MLSLSAKIRKTFKRKNKKLRKEGLVPAVLYGPGMKNLNLEVNLKEFEKILEKAGESSLISLDIDGKKHSVLIHDIQRDSLTGKPIHVDFYQPSLKEKVEVRVNLAFEGESPAVKMGGTLVKIFEELEVKAIPENLPKEIRVDISKLKNFHDAIVVADLELPKGVEVMRDKNDVIARVLPPEKTEEAKEKVEEKPEEGNTEEGK